MSNNESSNSRIKLYVFVLLVLVLAVVVLIIRRQNRAAYKEYVSEVRGIHAERIETFQEQKRRVLERRESDLEAILTLLRGKVAERQQGEGVVQCSFSGDAELMSALKDGDGAHRWRDIDVRFDMVTAVVPAAKGTLYLPAPWKGPNDLIVVSWKDATIGHTGDCTFSTAERTRIAARLAALPETVTWVTARGCETALSDVWPVVGPGAELAIDVPSGLACDVHVVAYTEHTIGEGPVVAIADAGGQAWIALPLPAADGFRDMAPDELATLKSRLASEPDPDAPPANDAPAAPPEAGGPKEP